MTTESEGTIQALIRITDLLIRSMEAMQGNIDNLADLACQAMEHVPLDFPQKDLTVTRVQEVATESEEFVIKVRNLVEPLIRKWSTTTNAS